MAAQQVGSDTGSELIGSAIGIGTTIGDEFPIAASAAKEETHPTARSNTLLPMIWRS